MFRTCFISFFSETGDINTPKSVIERWWDKYRHKDMYTHTCIYIYNYNKYIIILKYCNLLSEDSCCLKKNLCDCVSKQDNEPTYIL